MSERRRIGVIVRGSLTEGLEMRLDEGESVEDVRAGKFVVIEGEKSDFFCMITDVRLDATNPAILVDPPAAQDDEADALMRQVLSGTSTYGTVMLKPMLMLPSRDDAGTASEGAARAADRGTLPSTTQIVKTVPRHFSIVAEATEADVNLVFGSEEQDRRYYYIGRPLDMETPVCLDLDRFIERSNGIFGRTGTGKTFLTRLILSGLVKSGKASALVFDMHSEYGWGARREGDHAEAKGLRQLFGASRVAVFSLDPESSRRRGVSPDVEVKIPYDRIDVEDILPLADELNLNPTAADSLYLVQAQYGSEWLERLLGMGAEEVRDLARELGAHAESFAAVHRKLSRLKRLDFLVPRAPDDAVDRIMEALDRRQHVVLEFGTRTDLLVYMLVANILTREIRERYVRKTETYLATKRPQDRPHPLVITIEEAHKFLNPQAARQTIFGTIARELRKYFVSLLVVDQRPSGIDDEILSQLGTRVTALLSDEKDIAAVLTGVSNAQWLRSVLASLDTRQQALLMGHAVPMPVVIRTRDYDAAFYRAMGAEDEEPGRGGRGARAIDDLFGSR
ncbi:MAG TPA: ATP-binding protein [Thermodesulfobacteriota bacterium]